jgi:hypothetical protein
MALEERLRGPRRHVSADAGRFGKALMSLYRQCLSLLAMSARGFPRSRCTLRAIDMLP